MNELELERKLHSHNIPLESWGKGEAKTLKHLSQELALGESQLVEDGEGNLVRVENGVGINIFYIEGSRAFRLDETKQNFADGRTRQRGLNTSVGEKVKLEESIDEAAERTLREELGILGVALLNCRFEDRPPVLSESFPGLVTKRNVHVFDSYLLPQDFKQNGYVERQPDKTTYFEWHEFKARESGLERAERTFVQEIQTLLGDQALLADSRLTARLKPAIGVTTKPHDLVGVRGIISTPNHCQTIGQMVIERYEVTRFRDFISEPWNDGYQSIHLDLSYFGTPIKLQLRTTQMDAYAKGLIKLKGEHYWKVPGFKK